MNHWLTIPLFITTLFAFGYQAVPFFVWLYIPIILVYTRNNKKSYHCIFITYIITSIALSLGYLGVLRMDHEGPAFPYIPTVIGFTFFTNTILLATLFADRYTTRNSQCIYTRVFLFPTVWTGLWFLYSKFSILGDYPAFSTALVHWADFSQAASLGGRATLDFLIALSGTVIFEIHDYPLHSLLSKNTTTIQKNLLERSPVINKKGNNEKDYHKDNATSNKRQWTTLLLHPVSIYAIIMFSVFTYGGVKLNIRRGSFYQAEYSEYAPKTASVGCVVGPGILFYDLRSDHDLWFNKTADLAKAGAKLIIWSETTANVQNEKDEIEFLERTKKLAIAHGIYIGVAYEIAEPVLRDKLVLVTKEGEIGINYSKSHPVPGLEQYSAGPNILQYVDTVEFGRIGGGICFDYSFSDFVKQASEHKIDLMLQSGWTWSPISTHHQQGHAIRAVENGFTLFRCFSQGISGITEPTLNAIYDQKVSTNNVEQYIFHLPLQKRIATLYGYIGDSFSYLCILASLGLILNIFYKIRKDKLSI